MKQWRVDNYIIGPAIDADYDHTADELAEVLNSYERKGYKYHLYNHRTCSSTLCTFNNSLSHHCRYSCNW